MQEPIETVDHSISSQKRRELLITKIFKSSLDIDTSVDDFNIPVGPIRVDISPGWFSFQSMPIKVLVYDSIHQKNFCEIYVHFEIFKICGYSSGFAMLVPSWGHDNISGRADLRSDAIRAAARALLLAKRAHTVWGRYILANCLTSSKCSTESGIVYVSLREPERLRIKLPSSIDHFIARLTNKTRRSLRYYSKKLEDELSCQFVAEMNEEQVSAAIRALCFSGRYSISDEIALTRHSKLRMVEGSFVAGLRDKHGRWISAIGGWRRGACCFIVWQLNLDLAAQSVSNTMRLKFVEHEIQNKKQYLAFVGGTSGLWCRACEIDHSESFLAFDAGLRANITRALASLIRPDSRIARLYKKSLPYRIKRIIFH